MAETKPAVWDTVQVHILCDCGERHTVPCKLISPGLAITERVHIHRDKNDPRPNPRCVVHVASGCGLGFHEDPERVAAYAFAVAELGDWTVDRLTLLRDIPLRSAVALLAEAFGMRFGPITADESDLAETA